MLAAGVWATSGEGEGRVGATRPGWLHILAQSLLAYDECGTIPSLECYGALIPVIPQPSDEIDPLVWAPQHLVGLDTSFILKHFTGGPVGRVWSNAQMLP